MYGEDRTYILTPGDPTALRPAPSSPNSSPRRRTSWRQQPPLGAVSTARSLRPPPNSTARHRTFPLSSLRSLLAAAIIDNNTSLIRMPSRKSLFMEGCCHAHPRHHHRPQP